MTKPSRLKTIKEFKLRTAYFETLKETSAAVNSFMAEFFSSRFQLVPELGEQLMDRYASGKTQLRPSSVRFAYELVGGEDWQATVPAGASLVLKEISYYCLDDVIDAGAEQEIALMSLPFLSLSYGVISELPFSAEQVRGVLQELLMLDELLDQGFIIEQNMSSEEDYLQRLYGYNFWEQALRMGGILGEASQEDVYSLGEIGKNIGMAIMLTNDTWDFAKKLEDFKRGIHTGPIDWALSNSTREDASTLEELFGKSELSEEEIEEVRRIAVAAGTLDYGRQMSKQFCDTAVDMLSQFPESRARDFLGFATRVTQKNKFYDMLEGK
ncbi:polyprenyl synthetase family protein [Nanoarchaeota archaeon]